MAQGYIGEVFYGKTKGVNTPQIAYLYLPFRI